jgi:hypothetical protein
MTIHKIRNEALFIQYNTHFGKSTVRIGSFRFIIYRSKRYQTGNIFAILANLTTKTIKQTEGCRNQLLFVQMSMKVGRVKVGVRCRPAFQDEIDFAKGDFLSIVDCRAEAINDPMLGQLSLTLINGKQREFLYDYVFDSGVTQDHVYNRIAKPVVSDVLKGFNGTIFAYGQTGTGKVMQCKPLLLIGPTTYF